MPNPSGRPVADFAKALPAPFCSQFVGFGRLRTRFRMMPKCNTIGPPMWSSGNTTIQRTGVARPESSNGVVTIRTRHALPRASGRAIQNSHRPQQIHSRTSVPAQSPLSLHTACMATLSPCMFPAQWGALFATILCHSIWRCQTGGYNSGSTRGPTLYSSKT